MYQEGMGAYMLNYNGRNFFNYILVIFATDTYG